MHRVHGRADVVIVHVNAANDGSIEAMRFQIIDESLFMLQPTLPQDLEQRVPVDWLGQSSFRNLEIERRQMATAQMPNQIMRAADELSADLLHDSTVRSAKQLVDSSGIVRRRTCARGGLESPAPIETNMREVVTRELRDCLRISGRDACNLRNQARCRPV